MSRTATVAAAAAALVVLAQAVALGAVQWPVAAGGNGHYYEGVVVANGITWTAANAAAGQRGGYLATVTSLGEDDFVFSLITDSSYWIHNNTYDLTDGPWIGGWQDSSDPSYSEPGGGWKWVSGESWNYTGWANLQPDDNGGQMYLHYWYPGTTMSRGWDDSGLFDYKSYVIEWNTNPAPEPSTMFTVASGGLALLCTRRFRRPRH